MTANDVYQKLVAIFPDFAERWDAPGNCFREADGSFTLCGMFAEFSHYVRDRFSHLPVSSLDELGRFIEQCMESPGSDLHNAAATCFLENLASEVFTPSLASHLRERAREFLSQYGPVA